MRTRLIALPTLTVAIVFSLAASAFAAAPPSSPAVIQSVTFESPSDTLQTYTDFGGDPAGPATWGRVTQQHGSGSTYGFWCAGTSAAWGNYPAGTRGLAVLSVPDCSEWDESAIQYSYIEPTAESFDGGANPFAVNWVDAARTPTSSVAPTGYSDPFRPIASTWTTVVIPRGAIGNPPLSAGYLRFQFVSNPAAPSTGQGVTIDDIAVTGYKFGAVNNLIAARQHGDPSTVVVNWDAPYARGTSTPDTRDIWYRVWRHDITANTWAEVTSSRVDTTTFIDSGVPLAGTYQYTVQGWDASGELAWGKNAASNAVPQAVPQFVSASVAPSSVKYGGGSTLRAVMLDEVGELWASQQASISIQRRLSGGGWTTIAGGVSEIATGTYSANVQCTVSADYRLYHHVAGVGSSPVHVTASAYLTTPSTPAKVKRNRSFTVSGRVSGVPGLSRSVTLRLYHKETKRVRGKSTTVWALRYSAVVRVSASSGVVSYKKAMKVKLKGAYRATATVADVHSAWTKSGYRYFSAK